jgi:hypothetical protein
MRGLFLQKFIAGAGMLLLVADAAGPAVAATACYRPADIEAEQAIRYQTELMVLSDTCGGDTYRDFTVHNSDTIKRYQQAMMAHFRRTGARNPTGSFDTYQTKLANEIALTDGKEPVQTVCDRSSVLLQEAKTLDGVQFRERVAALAAENGKNYRQCR